MLVIFFIDFVEYVLVTLSSSFDDSFAPIEIETEVYYRMIILKFFLLFLFQRIVIYILEKRVFERSIFFSLGETIEGDRMFSRRIYSSRASAITMTVVDFDVARKRCDEA